MKKESLSLEMIFFDSEKELETDDFQLLMQARIAAGKAYAPYSRFRVGAAVLLSNGMIILGNNQENAAYPSGLCAERVALFYAFSMYPDEKVVAIAVTALSEKALINKPLTPCGSCRQVMAEYEKKADLNMRVIMQGQEGPVMVVESMKNLLPFSFIDDYLFKYSAE